MPTSDANNRTDRLNELQLLFYKNPKQRFTTPEIATWLGVSEDTTLRDLNALSGPGRLPLRKEGRFWVLMEAAHFIPSPSAITLNYAEATVLSIAGRLLSQIHDEQNSHVLQALLKIVRVLPEPVAAHQHAIVDMAKARQKQQSDRSAIFEALAIGWVTRHRVQLRYTTSKGKTFRCTFAPYLFEPSGIGHTVYVIGHSTPPDKLRTFKLERIIEATLLKQDTFELPPDFNGPELLQKAWVVMFGQEEQEPITVRLHFTSRVATRLKETLWHPTQHITETAQGCEMTIRISETLELENWIRGWGPDCEVLEPAFLRDRMIADLRRSARLYGISLGEAAPPDEADEELFDTFFGEE